MDPDMDAAFNCPICGFDKPHAHDDRQVREERVVRPAFEKLIAGSDRLQHMINQVAIAGFNRLGSHYRTAPTEAWGGGQIAYPTVFGWNGIKGQYASDHWAYRPRFDAPYPNEILELLWLVYREVHPPVDLPTSVAA